MFSVLARHKLLGAALALLAGAILFTLLLPSPGAGAPLTAVGVRIADHPAYVRAVVDLTGAPVAATDVVATDAQPFDGAAALRVSAARAATRARTFDAASLTVRLRAMTGGLAIELTAAPGRFKYVAYGVLGGGRLAVDLYKSAPPSPAATIRSGGGGRLTIATTGVARGSVTATGAERGLFEHQFALVLRGADGHVLARAGVTALSGRWRARLDYRTTTRQRATLEAVAASPKDGALACIAQVPVLLPAA